MISSGPIESLHNVAAVLRGAQHVTIAAHEDPDGDAIGSVLGLALALDMLDIPNTPVLSSGRACPATYAFLPGSERFVQPAIAARADVFVALDSPNLSRLGAATELARSARTLVMIDHHPDAVASGTLNVLDSSSAATGVLLWELLPHLAVTPDARIAECLYAALLTDTGRFSYSNTTPEALRVAAAMLETGVRPNDVYAAIYETRSAGAQQLVGRTLARITTANGGRFAYAWIGPEDFTETGALPEEAENLVDHVRALGGVDVVMLARLRDGGVHGSLRAKGDADVGAIARAFGGGGHRAAAGFTYDGDLESLLAMILPMLPGGSR